MDPQLKSVFTTLGMTLATSAATAAASHGYIHSADTAPVADAIVTAVGALITAGLGWYKAHQVSPAVLIQTVNQQPNGVKVVPATAPTEAVNAPVTTEKK